RPIPTLFPYTTLFRSLQGSHAVRRVSRLSGLTDSHTTRIDRIVLHRYWGFPVFFLVLVSLFAAIFWAAQPFVDAIDAGFSMAGRSEEHTSELQSRFDL